MSGSLPFSRIRAVRDPKLRTLTVEEHQAEFLIGRVEPVYPPEARANGIEGKVELDVVVGKDGVVQTVSVRAGDPLLTEAAMEAVRQWTYRPTMVNGIPVEVATEVELSFSLDK
jgi:protein TonB